MAFTEVAPGYFVDLATGAVQGGGNVTDTGAGFAPIPPAPTPTTTPDMITMYGPNGQPIQVVASDTGTITALLGQGYSYTPTTTPATTPPTGGTMPTDTPGLPGATAPPPWEYGEFAPETAWTQQLGAQGLLGQSPYQQWMQNQFSRVYSNWLTRSLLGYEMPSTQQTPPWTSAPTYWGQGAGNWQSLLGLGAETPTRQFLAGQPGTAYGMGLSGARAAGAPAPLISWLSGQYEPQREQWEAFGQPGMPGTTGQSWLEWLGQSMGLGSRPQSSGWSPGPPIGPEGIR